MRVRARGHSRRVVAIRFADGKNTETVLETGIYNLTESQAQALLHHGAGKTQDVVLVRLDEPESAEGE